MSKMKPKPCPFCDGVKVEYLKNYRTHIACFKCKDSIEFPNEAVQCLSCGAVMFGDIKAWDRRPK